jgi:hypothetical protein
MKKIPLSVLLSACILFSFAADTFSQDAFGLDSAQYVKAITPYNDSIDFRMVTYATYPLSDSVTARFNITSPVFQNLYNHVPGLPIAFENALIRNGNIRFMPTVLYLVDGMPYNASIAAINPLSNFEIGNGTVVPGMHGASAFGVWGTNGAFFLESKSGEGFTRSVVEVASTTSKLATGVDFSESNLFESIAIDYLRQTTNASWKRDFGKLDTRIALNHQIMKGEASEANYDVTEKWYGASTNTGFSSGRLKARFIGNVNLRDLDASQNQIEGKDVVYGGQLKLGYALTSKLQLHSNTLLQRRNWERDDLEGRSESWEKRIISNLLLNYKLRSQGVSWNSFGGLHLERWTDKPSNLPGFVQGDKWESKGTSLLLGTEMLIRSSLAFRGVVRRDFTREDGVWSTTFGAAYSLNDVVRNHDMKVRMSYGEATVGGTIFPSRTLAQFPFQYYSRDIYLGYRKKSFETGLDFFSSRKQNFSATLNFYRDVIDGHDHPVDVNVIKAQGVEAVANYNTQFSDSRLTNRVLIGYGELDDPAWRQNDRLTRHVSLVNEYASQKVIFCLVTEFRNFKGSDSNSSVPENFVWIRSAGFSYIIDDAFANSEVVVGIVGRNLLLSTKEDSFNPENFNFPTKSISLNLTFTFQ